MGLLYTKICCGENRNNKIIENLQRQNENLIGEINTLKLENKNLQNKLEKKERILKRLSTDLFSTEQTSPETQFRSIEKNITDENILY